MCTPSLFQSTPSARRATPYSQIAQLAKSISIHALREEGDLDAVIEGAVSLIFQSTPSARRATLPASGYSYNLKISIHALREEGDEVLCCFVN